MPHEKSSVFVRNLNPLDRPFFGLDSGEISKVDVHFPPTNFNTVSRLSIFCCEWFFPVMIFLVSFVVFKRPGKSGSDDAEVGSRCLSTSSLVSILGGGTLPVCVYFDEIGPFG